MVTGGWQGGSDNAPAIVTRVPPSDDPLFGDTAVTTGVDDSEYWYKLDAPPVKLTGYVTIVTLAGWGTTVTLTAQVPVAADVIA